jgi:hypothetical protein
VVVVVASQVSVPCSGAYASVSSCSSRCRRRIYEDASASTPPELRVLVGHRDRDGDAGRDERDCLDA